MLDRLEEGSSGSAGWEFSSGSGYGSGRGGLAPLGWTEAAGRYGQSFVEALQGTITTISCLLPYLWTQIVSFKIAMYT